MPDGSRPQPSRGHKKRERTRALLVDAALEVIAERGEAFSVSDVTDRAGVANGTFYNYFADRRALIEAIVPEVLGSFAAESADLVAEDDPAARFAAITAMALEHALDHPERMRVLLRLEAAQEQLLRGETVRHLREDLAAGAASGRFTVEPGPAVLDVVVGTILTAVRRLVAGVEVTDDHPAEVVELLLRSLGVESAEARRLATEAVSRRH